MSSALTNLLSAISSAICQHQSGSEPLQSFQRAPLAQLPEHEANMYVQQTIAQVLCSGNTESLDSSFLLW